MNHSKFFLANWRALKSTPLIWLEYLRVSGLLVTCSSLLSFPRLKSYWNYMLKPCCISYLSSITGLTMFSRIEGTLT